MLSASRNLLNLGGQQNRTFYVLFLAFFTFTIGLVWAGNAIRAEIVNIDLDLFATAQQVSSFSVIVLSLVYTALVDSVAKDRMFIAITALGMVGIALASVLLNSGPASFYENTLLILWILYIVMFYMWVIHWGTFIIDVYDVRTAKRIYPLLGIARPLGTIVAGLSYGIMTSVVQVGESDLLTVMVVWIITLGVVVGLLFIAAILIRRSDEFTLGTEQVTPGERGSNFSNLMEGIQYLFNSSFVAWMAVSALLVIGLNTLTEYQASEIIRDYVADRDDPTAAFAEFTAFWDGISNLAAIFLQLFVFNRLMDQIGLRSMIMIYPLMALSVSAGLIITPLIAMAVLAWVNVNALRRVFRDPIVGLMGNAVPSRAKGRVRAVINGLISPAGAVLAASLLRLIPVIDAVWFLPLLLGVTAALYVISAIALRREYALAMVRVLEDKSLSYMLSQTKDVDALKMGLTDRERLTLLSDQLDQSDDPEFKMFLLQLISETGGADAVPIVARLLNETDDLHLRQQIIRTFVEYGEPTRAVQKLYVQLLEDSDDVIRGQALKGLGSTMGQHNRGYLKLAHAFLDDPSPIVRAQAIPAMMAARQRIYNESARTRLAQLLAASDPEQLVLGIRILGDSDDPRAIASLLSYLNSPYDEVRLEATKAIDSVWHDELPPDVYAQIKRHIPQFLGDPVAEIRLVELRLLGRFKDNETASALIRALGDEDEAVRRAALSAVVRIGDMALPGLEAALQTDNEHRVQLAVIALSRIAPNQYQDALENRVGTLLDLLYQNYKRLYAVSSFAVFGSVKIILESLREENQRILDEVFLLLQYFGDTSDADYNLEVVRESLASEDPNVRANALETLEAISTPQITRHMAPIFDSNSTLAQLARRSPDGGQQADPFDVLFQFAFNDDHALSSVMLYAFAEIGNIHPDMKDQKRSVFDVRKLDPPPGVNMEALQQIDIRQILVAVRAASSSRREHIRATSKAAMALLNGQSLQLRLREHKADGTINEDDVMLLSTVERMIVLKKVALFSTITVDHLQAVATICEERFFSKGDVMFRRGDPGNELFIVVEGEVRIGLHNNDETGFQELAVYKENSYFGEMTLFQDLPRSAAAVAVSDVLVLTVRGAVLIGLMREYPDLAVALLRTVSGHLSAMNDRIANLHNQLNP